MSKTKERGDKVRVLVVFVGVIAFLVTFVLGWILVRSGVILFKIYPYSVSRMVEYLKSRGRGYDDEANRKAVECNLRFRLVATVMVYLTCIILVLCVPPWRVIGIADIAIRVGCLIGWLQVAYFSYEFELEQLAIIAYLDRIEKVDTEKSERDEAAVFVDLDGQEYRFYLSRGEENRPEEGDRYVVVGDPNRYWVYSSTTRHLRLLKEV